MKENGKNKLTKEKKILFTSLGCVAVGIALLGTVIGVSLKDKGGDGNEQLENPPASEDVSGGTEDENQGDQTVGGDTPSDGTQDDNQPATTPEGFVLPIETAVATNGFGFYYNQTLNNYYEHEGLDFSAEVGANVVAVDDGVVESVYVSDVLSGTEITIDHGNGLKTVYRFVTPADGLNAGDSVSKGQVIATVAEANGSEYKDGAHLHFEVLENGKNVDPVDYLSLEEK